ncbi:hypothetical protein E4U41_004454 [Claviceps citrina]|nr:hypothetical protein E4U41_004454 [Claviceps citrina]
MSTFKFGTPSSSSAPSDNATATAPASGSMFGNKPGSPLKFAFGAPGGSSGDGTSPSTSGGSVFGQKPAGASAGGLFSGVGSSANATPTSTSGASLFGGASTTPSSGSIFGKANEQPATSTSAAPSPGSMFGTATPKLTFGGGGSSSGASPFAALGNASQPQSTTTTTPAPSSGLFANTGSSLFAKKTDTPATTAAESTTPAPAAATPAKSLSSLASTTPAGAPPADKSADTSAPASTTGTSAGNMFANKAASTSGSSAGNMFAAAAGATTGATGSTSSLFSAKPAASNTSGSAAEAPATTTASAFGNKADASTPATGGFLGAKSTADAATKEEPKPATPQNGAASAFGASTAGPTSQMARLKNKTMEDIVTRWASDLTKYQKEFKGQATVVSGWDRSLVDNGEKIQKLYLDTFEAERASHEIERQLAAVESQQEELEAWLNRYESEVQDMFAKQIGPREQLAGPDQERERTYKLAEKLTQHLDEKSRDLSKMVKEINDISGTLSKGAKTEDPLSQIVRVLNGHLTQLQWIDVNASALQAKVTAAQKSSNSLSGHYAGPESDAAEGFYRSYYGRR